MTTAPKLFIDIHCLHRSNVKTGKKDGLIIYTMTPPTPPLQNKKKKVQSIKKLIFTQNTAKLLQTDQFHFPAGYYVTYLIAVVLLASSCLLVSPPVFASSFPAPTSSPQQMPWFQ